MHLEVMWVHGRGPVLVEANCGRWNGEEFALLQDVCYGTNAYDAAFAATLGDEDDWAQVNLTPPDLTCLDLTPLDLICLGST